MSNSGITETIIGLASVGLMPNGVWQEQNDLTWCVWLRFVPIRQLEEGA